MGRLKGFFKDTAAILSAEFQRSANVQHSGLKGKDREVFIDSFLQRSFPKKFVIGTGEIIDHEDNISGQADIVIYDEYMPVFDYAATKHFLSEGVFAHIEVKSNLTGEEIKRSLNITTSIKKLKKEVDPIIELSDIDQKIFSCVFAYTGLSKEKFKEHVLEYYDDQPDINGWVDMIAVNNEYIMLKVGDEDNAIKIGFFDTKEDTLMMFFTRLYKAMLKNWVGLPNFGKYIGWHEYKAF